MKKAKNYKLKKILKNVKPYIKIDKKIVNVEDTEIEEHKFYQYKSCISINEQILIK